MTFPGPNQLRIATAIQFLLACGAIYEGTALRNWRAMPADILAQSPELYSGYDLSQKIWLACNGASMLLTLFFMVIALRRREEIDGGTIQLKWRWSLLFVPPVCAMLHGAWVWF